MKIFHILVLVNKKQQNFIVKEQNLELYSITEMKVNQNLYGNDIIN